jgi:hypothetical protein
MKKPPTIETLLTHASGTDTVRTNEGVGIKTTGKPTQYAKPPESHPSVSQEQKPSKTDVESTETHVGALQRRQEGSTPKER